MPALTQDGRFEVYAEDGGHRLMPGECILGRPVRGGAWQVVAHVVDVNKRVGETSPTARALMIGHTIDQGAHRAEQIAGHVGLDAFSRGSIRPSGGAFYVSLTEDGNDDETHVATLFPFSNAELTAQLRCSFEVFCRHAARMRAGSQEFVEPSERNSNADGDPKHTQGQTHVDSIHAPSRPAPGR